MRAAGAGRECTRAREEGFWWDRVVRCGRGNSLDARKALPPTLSTVCGKKQVGPLSGPIQDRVGWHHTSGPGGWRVSVGDALSSQAIPHVSEKARRRAFPWASSMPDRPSGGAARTRQGCCQCTQEYDHYPLKKRIMIHMM